MPFGVTLKKVYCTPNYPGLVIVYPVLYEFLLQSNSMRSKTRTILETLSSGFSFFKIIPRGITPTFATSGKELESKLIIVASLAFSLEVFVFFVSLV